MKGSTHELRWPDSEHALYVTINDVEHDGRRRPFEIFVNSEEFGALRLGDSAYAHDQRGVSPRRRRAFVAEELKQIFDPRGGQWSNGRYMPSLVAAIGDLVERHTIKIGFLSATDSVDTPPQVAESQAASSWHLGPALSKVHSAGPHQEAGCLSCMQCGWANCS